MERIENFIERYIPINTIPRIGFTDIIEIIIIAVIIYLIMTWLKNTRATVLVRGIGIIIIFCILAYIFQMNTILFLLKAGSYVAITVIVVVFQPELRRALETLGRQNIINDILFGKASKISASLTDRSINEMTRACFAMGKVRTGALIVVEMQEPLREYARTGIDLNAAISCELLENIFEHNTPLHDGAVIVGSNLILAATCYLPLSKSQELSKDLGTRHRAAVGISEVTDSITLIVSEETGSVSIAMDGRLYHNVNAEFVREKLSLAMDQSTHETGFDRIRNKFRRSEK